MSVIRTTTAELLTTVETALHAEGTESVEALCALGVALFPVPCSLFPVPRSPLPAPRSPLLLGRHLDLLLTLLALRPFLALAFLLVLGHDARDGGDGITEVE